jgi:hypothetical protein
VPRFYFHTQDGHAVPDSGGVELVDIASARAQAVAMTGEMLRDLGDRFWGSESFSLTVTNSDHLTLFTILVAAVNSPALHVSR